MKLIHWAVIFVIIITPFSIVARNNVQKKILVLQDETRINNVLDNATYDAVSQIIEVSEELGYGKNIPITKGVAMASIDRFFQSMAVNFNMPSNTTVAKDYFGQFIPAIIIVGYDGLYVYSYENTFNEGYRYVLKPKVPFAYTDPDTNIIINFTLGNDVKVFLPDENICVEGYVGSISDDNEEIKILNDLYFGNTNELMNTLPYLTTNVSYILSKYNNFKIAPDYMFVDGVDNDYEYDNNGNVIEEASRFHKLRRDTIVNLITATLREEINEHNTYAKLIGVDYDFYFPNISREEWNNSIDDISFLAFFQGMPIGTDSYYNNYSLGGSRIVRAKLIYTTDDGLYHKYSCPRINPDGNENKYNGIYINAKDAHSAGYWACELCR